jgi:hypothetical protein
MIRRADACPPLRTSVLVPALCRAMMVQSKNNFGRRTRSLMTVKAAVLP